MVLDAPPTGRIGRFLNVTAETARLAKVGPIKTQSEGVAAILRSPITAVHVVTLLEEMPVQETADAVDELHRAAASRSARIIVNATQPAAAGRRARCTQAELRARAWSRPGLPADQDLVAGLHAEARAHLTRRGLEDVAADRAAPLGRPMVELPLLPGGVDPPASTARPARWPGRPEH